MRLAVILSSCVGITAATLLGRQLTYPTCVFPCLGVMPHGDCSLTDNACLCKDENYVVLTAECIREKCGDPNDVQNANDISVTLCRMAGVDLSTQSAFRTDNSAHTPTATGVSATTTVTVATATTTVSSSTGSRPLSPAFFGAIGLAVMALGF